MEDKDLLMVVTLKDAEEKFVAKDYKKAYEIIAAYLKDNAYSMEILFLKLKIEENLNKLDDALKTADMILFIMPYHQESHIVKIKILQKK
jgi:hypothetical protein